MIGAVSKTGKILYGPKLLGQCARCVFRHVLSNVGLVQKKNKVFAIGFNKTGTSSLHEIFVKLGFHSNHGEHWRKTDSILFHIMFDAFCDGIPEDFTKLDKSFSDSKFILQVRDLDAWISSRIEHIHRRPKNRNNAVSEDWTMEEESIIAWILKRNEYHAQVMEYFSDRPDDLLVINYIRDPSAAERIAQFLGSDLTPKKSHANRNKKSTGQLKHADLIHSCFRKLGLPEDEWSSDLLCKSLLDEDRIVDSIFYDTSCMFSCP